MATHSQPWSLAQAATNKTNVALYIPSFLYHASAMIRSNIPRTPASAHPMDRLKIYSSTHDNHNSV